MVPQIAARQTDIMARPRYIESETAVSLFPFLSVLAGVIGTLALLVAGMTLIGLQDTDQIIELPHEKATEKTPVYVECRHDGLLIHPEGTYVPQEEIEEDDNAWEQLLGDLEAHSAERYLVLLLRPDGLDSFESAYPMARGADIDVGFDPVYAAGEIRFRPAELGKPP